MESVSIEVIEDEKSVRMCVMLPERKKAREKPMEFSKRDAFAEFNIRGHIVEDVESVSGPNRLSNYRTKGQPMPALKAEFVIVKSQKKEKVEIKPKPKTSNKRSRAKKPTTLED